MTTPDSYYRRLAWAESPTGEDNRLGSGAFGRYQFMPATAAAYAQRTAWGKGLSPANVKAAIQGDKAREDELARLYTADSDIALSNAGLPSSDSSRLALHRFGQGGGVSLLKADPGMPVADWVRSVNWGNGVSPDAVIRQNRLDQYANVGDLRSRFLGVPEAPPEPVTQPAPQVPPAPRPGLQAAPQPPVLDLSGLFTTPDTGVDRQRADAARRRRLALFS